MILLQKYNVNLNAHNLSNITRFLNPLSTPNFRTGLIFSVLKFDKHFT
jgi:hypothetical protein